MLTKKSDVYLVQWIIGTTSYSGVALRQGDNLAASWAIVTEKGVIRGVNLYRIEGTSAGPVDRAGCPCQAPAFNNLKRSRS